MHPNHFAMIEGFDTLLLVGCRYQELTYTQVQETVATDTVQAYQIDPSIFGQDCDIRFLTERK